MKRLIYTFFALVFLLQAKGQLSQTRTAQSVRANSPALWNNLSPSSLSADDNNMAYTNKLVATSNTNMVELENFGFSIPSNAVISSLKLEMRKYKKGGELIDYVVQLLKSGCSYGPFLAYNSNPWPNLETSIFYSESGGGSITNTNCGSVNGTYQWTPADINNSIGAVFYAVRIGRDAPTIAYVEKVALTVYYTLPSSAFNRNQPLNEEGNQPFSMKVLQDRLVITSPVSGKYDLYITDILGRAVQKQIIYTTENSPKIVPLDKKLNGVYFITCTGNGFTKTIKSFLQ